MDAEGFRELPLANISRGSRSRDFETLAAYSNDNYNLIGLGARKEFPVAR
jgi:hypothetical protein